MSTKTSIKRIALVAVAALGFGMVSTVSANAAETAATTFNIMSSSASSVDAAASTTSTLTYASAGLTLTAGSGTPFAATDVGRGIWSDEYGFIGTIAERTSSTVVVLAAAPSASASGTTTAMANTNTTNNWWIGTKAATTVNDGITATTIKGMTVTAGATAALNLKFNAATDDDVSKARILVNGTVLGTSELTAIGDQNKILPFTAPVVAGTYEAQVQFSPAASFADTTVMVTKSFTLTVTAAADFSAALSTAYMGAPAGTGMTSTTNAVARSASKTNGTAIASIEIILKKSDGTLDTQAHTITAVVSGSGYVKADATSATGTAATARVSTNSSGSSTRYVHIGADGTAGTGSVTVTLTNANTDAVTTLGTWSYSTYGAATKLAVDTTNYTIGRAGGYKTGEASTTRAAGNEALGATDHSTVDADSGITGTTVPAFVIKVTDSAGSAVNLTSTVGAAIVPTVVSSDTSVISTGSCALDAGSTTYGSSTNGIGYYNCSFTTAPGSVSGGKATLTIRTPNPADTTTYLTTTVDVTVGGSVANSTLKLDKASYAPGEGMTVTRSATDASGNPVYDGAAAGAVSFTKSVGGTSPAADFFVGGTVSSDNSLGKQTVFAPVTAGDFTASMTGKTAAVTAQITAAATVADENASATLDAANEATDAANAATDAANAAAEAADAATAAAQDAQAAVAALATSVSSLIAGIKAQITSLTNLVIKIQKKVKA